MFGQLDENRTTPRLSESELWWGNELVEVAHLIADAESALEGDDRAGFQLALDRAVLRLRVLYLNLRDAPPEMQREASDALRVIEEAIRAVGP